MQTFNIAGLSTAHIWECSVSLFLLPLGGETKQRHYPDCMIFSSPE